MTYFTNTLFVGKVRYHFTNLASTNMYAAELLSSKKLVEGTLISAYDQSDGRGQVGNKWESAPNQNLMFSLIFYPNFLRPQEQFLLNQAISLAVHDFTINFLNNSVKVKWSNDIYVEKEKISGILIQNTLSKTQIQSTIVGIGFNLNQTIFEYAPNATSLKAQTGESYDIETALQQICWHIEKRYLQLKSQKYNLLNQNYLSNLFQYAEDALYEKRDGTTFSGKITGIDPLGRLLISHSKGEETFGFKEVKFLL